MRRFYRWPRRKDDLREEVKGPSPLRIPGTVWMADLKKAGERVEYLCSQGRKKGRP
jgi:hypothetical protein